MFTAQYLALKKYLQTKFPELKEIAWYQQQYRQGTIFVTPALYVEFETTNTQRMGRGIQMYENLYFNLHLVGTALQTDDKRVEDNSVLDHHKLARNINQSVEAIFRPRMSYLKPDHTPNHQIMNSIQRQSIKPDHTLSSLIVTIQRYKCTAYDIELPDTISIEPDLVIEPSAE